MSSLPPPSARIPVKIQDLPPRWAHLCLEVSTFTSEMIESGLSGKRILLAVSGGVDSLCLLLIFKSLEQKFNLILEVAHLDHGFRPSSENEAKWVKQFCQSLGLACHIQRASKISNQEHKPKGLEEKGRNWRYAFFEKLREQQQLDYIALAHNLNDLAEDQLMRMIRGCGWPELGGMPAYDPRRKLIRPILMQPRVDLQQMLNELDIPFIIDESNASPDFMRNRVRMNIVPQLMQENNGYLEHAQKLWSLAQTDQSFWDEYLDRFEFKTTKNQIILPLSIIFKEKEAVRLRMFRFCLQKLAELCGLDQIFTPAAQLFEINRAIMRRKSGQGSGVMQIQFPGGIVVVVGTAELVFCCSCAG